MKPSQYLPLIQKIKDKIKDDPVVVEFCEKYDFDPEDIDLIPTKFDKINVSAKTDQGIVTFNYKFIDDFDTLLGLAVHEYRHYVSQSHHPTQSADDGDYLSNPEEIKAFQSQLEFINDNEGKEEANRYVNQVLDHHNEKGKEREEKKEILMKKVESFKNLAMRL